jgi:transposase-like protein
MRRKFSRAFKLSALRRLEAGDSVAEVAELSNIDPSVLRRWRRTYDKAPESAFPGAGRRPRERGLAELRRQIERHAQEIDFLKRRIECTEAQLHLSSKTNFSTQKGGQQSTKR